jgi:hypothetical protein
MIKLDNIVNHLAPHECLTKNKAKESIIKRLEEGF